jgi:hypothetical protein
MSPGTFSVLPHARRLSRPPDTLQRRRLSSDVLFREGLSEIGSHDATLGGLMKPDIAHAVAHVGVVSDVFCGWRLGISVRS